MGEDMANWTSTVAAVAALLRINDYDLKQKEARAKYQAMR